ncbi:hypothetical protein BKA93DRAFT_754051 [Sparassis latifolia]
MWKDMNECGLVRVVWKHAPPDGGLIETLKLTKGKLETAGSCGVQDELGHNAEAVHVQERGRAYIWRILGCRPPSLRIPVSEDRQVVDTDGSNLQQGCRRDKVLITSTLVHGDAPVDGALEPADYPRKFVSDESRGGVVQISPEDQIARGRTKGIRLGGLNVISSAIASLLRHRGRCSLSRRALPHNTQ